MFKTALKLIFRNWWRNKTFTLISILSLTVGIACTALLISFVSYEYGIEKDNPNRDKLVWVMQDMPSYPGEKVAYMRSGVPEQLQEKYPEMEGFLQLNSFGMKYIEVNNQHLEPMEILNVDASFPEFFPFELLYGSWNAFHNPQSIVLSEKQAQKFFGNENALGKQITVCKEDGFSSEKIIVYTVGAVTKSRTQSAIIFDGLVCDPENNWGGPTLLMMPVHTDRSRFEEKVKKDRIPTLAGGQYYFYSFDQSISSTYNQQQLNYWHYKKNSLLLVGLISAILVFLTAVFNYVNMSFSRVLQQVKALHTQKLMGARESDVRIQIFADTFLAVLISFVLAILMMHDLLPVFNQVVSVDFSPGYFYSKDFYPILILFVVVLTVIPAWIMSRKLSRLSGSDYRLFFVTKKNRWIGTLVTAQFLIAIALITAAITANRQVSLVKQNGDRYRNLIEISEVMEIGKLRELETRIQNIPGVSGVSTGNLPMMNAWIMHNTLRKESGEEIETAVLQLSGDKEFLHILKLRQLSGTDWETLFETNPHAVLVNKTFADALDKPETELTNEPLSKYFDSGDSLAVIGGVIEDFYFNSLEEKNTSILIGQYVHDPRYTSTLRVKLTDKGNSETFSTIKSVWRQTFPDAGFNCIDTYHEFIKLNSKIFEMSRLLNMYSLISILLTCFGLFGITFYAVQQRTKEIGIRKINGAKTPQLLWLLMIPMFVWMAVGFAVALPPAWWLMERWLQQFVYRVDVSVGSFLLALLLVAVVAFATVGWHVWRTARSNPVESLKAE
ncbi:ABC transporter permease [Proteiniphilum propionicum]|jgi:ABC-type antimicrobial peptide transport system permease subunit|uniref:ABC transporter permease n=6 Tax=Proteiniphilum TaxID=294702 RepID=UPI001EEA6CBD|nr:ABC transporter permease [Proteiniphilum propionicum]ULB35672.1 ABC transporter permease [Proteiniphilum propionicum]